MTNTPISIPREHPVLMHSTPLVTCTACGTLSRPAHCYKPSLITRITDSIGRYL